MPASYSKRDALRWPAASLTFILVMALVALIPASASAQYFGRNKVQYRTFDFDVLKTEHFDIHYYPEEAEAALLVSRMAERWNDRLSRFFSHDLRGRQAIILYAVSAHFRQTNVIEGLIGEGTGGVTESQRRRIALPVSGSLADTDHVLGHELVHAFQFDMTGADPRETMGQAAGILAFPLWFVEGMAEYLSLGPVDAQTTMWLRDAALREKLPHIKDLDKPEYFPYRWGHAFWAYIGARYGDRMVASLIRSAANPRSDLTGLARQLGTDPDTLTANWHAAIVQMTREVVADSLALASDPRMLLGASNGGGRYNLGAKVSPDGRRVAFFSERDRFSIELYVADAETGKIERQLSKTATDPHFDSLQFLNSAGAWSPDGRTLAIAAVRSGRPIIALIDVRSGRVTRELKLERIGPDTGGKGDGDARGLDDVLNPAFTPDGQSLIVSGNLGGLVDLYRLHIASGLLERLTHDPFADLEPVVTPDGRTVVFVTERFSMDLETLAPSRLRLAKLDLATRVVTPIAAFLQGKHISPQVTANGRSVTFIADPDGVSNLYRIGIDGGPVEQLSSVPTGVAGITSSSPALSASASGRLVFTVFEDDGHTIYVLDPDHTVSLVPAPGQSQGAVLPGRTTPGGDVYALLTNLERGLPSASVVPPKEPYQQDLALDALGQPSISGSIGTFGGRVSGGVSALFSDVLGDHGLGVEAQIGGALSDLGGAFVYTNRKHRWNWGTVLSASPWSIQELQARQDRSAGTTTVTNRITRQPVLSALATTAFPLNTVTRLEFGGGVQSLSYSTETRTGVYDTATENLLETNTVREKLAERMTLGQATAALVHDTSFFGATGPFYGTRSRLELGYNRGTITYTGVLADWRRYFMPVRPVTLGVRVMHYGRYGAGSEDERLIKLYAGYPEFVHGYGVGTLRTVECLIGAIGADCEGFRNLLGSRLLVTNLEVRVPFPGVLRGELEYGRVPVDLAAFYDAGVAWTSADRPAFAGGTRQVVRSVGAAVRVNVFGFVILEVAASHPFDRPDRGIKWQLGIRQGF